MSSALIVNYFKRVINITIIFVGIQFSLWQFLRDCMNVKDGEPTHGFLKPGCLYTSTISAGHL